MQYPGSEGLATYGSPGQPSRDDNFWDELNYFDSFVEGHDMQTVGEPLGGAQTTHSHQHTVTGLKVEDGIDQQSGEAAMHGQSAARVGAGTTQESGMLDAKAAFDVEEKVGGTAMSTSGEETKETEEMLTLKRKKAAVAAASRATRAKKKREMDDLRKRNVELLKERQEFRKIVANLQLKAQANREAGEIDLETENRLLRAELQEHKSFIAQFKQLADGIPVSNTAQHVAALKGAKAAVGQVLGLLNTSTVDPSWKQGHSRLHPELLMHYQRLPQGSTSTKATRINIRVDAPPISASLSALKNVQWKVWSDSDLSSRLSSHFGTVREKEIKEVALDVDNMECDPDTQVKVYYYREKRERKKPDDKVKSGSAKQPETDNVDTIFLITSKEDQLPYNAMPVNRDAGADSGANHRATSPKLFRTVVMATTSTQHSKDIVSAKPGIHRIESALLEGTVIREVGDGTVICTIVNSYPLNPVQSYSKSDFLSATSSEGWIDDEGYMTKASEQAANDFMRIFAESLGPEAARAYVMETVRLAAMKKQAET